MERLGKLVGQFNLRAIEKNQKTIIKTATTATFAKNESKV
jgi:hypothetical protein